VLCVPCMTCSNNNSNQIRSQRLYSIMMDLFRGLGGWSWMPFDDEKNAWWDLVYHHISRRRYSPAIRKESSSVSPDIARSMSASKEQTHGIFYCAAYLLEGTCSPAFCRTKGRSLVAAAALFEVQPDLRFSDLDISRTHAVSHRCVTFS